MPLLKDGRIVEDEWIALDETQVHADDAPLIVDLDSWLKNRGDFSDRDAPLGLRLLPGQSPEAIKDDLHRFSLIALEFPAFKDGRAYSYARLLRERYGFAGELRAVGEVLQDQLRFMVRVGFDAFEVDERVTPEIFAAETQRFTHAYQPSSDGVATVVSQRARG